MAVNVSIPEAATQFIELMNRVRLGEEIIISEAGVPIARLLPISNKSPRIPGEDKGTVIIASDFNEPLPEDILKDFLDPANPQI